MFRRGRPVVSLFRPDEQLYRRFAHRDTVNGELTPACLQFPKKNAQTGHSVNRSAFSKPEDVLWVGIERLEGAGIFQFAVRSIPDELSCAQTNNRYAFFPQHVPLDDNYAHTEIWCDHIPRQNAGYVLPNSLVKKEFRARLLKSAQIVRRPES